MAKIDVSKIEGYLDMTPEQKLAALEGLAIPDPDYTGYVKKEIFDKTASETAEWKKKYNALSTEKGAAETESSTRISVLETELVEMKKVSKVAETKAQFLAVGYSEQLADETAKAFIDGDTATVFANQKKFNAEREKTLRAEILKTPPIPPAGQGKTTMTKEEYRKLSLPEKQKLASENIELYKKLNSEE